MTDEPTRALLYRRVSTRERADSGLGLAAQLDRLEAEAAPRGWAAELVTDSGVSRVAARRGWPELELVLATLGAGDALVVTRPDRLARSVLDFAQLLARSEDEGWSVVVLDLGIDTTTESGQLIAHVMVALAEWERKMIGRRVREGMAKSDRWKPGLPAVRGARPTPIPDTVREAVLDLREAGKSPGRIAARLNAHAHNPLRRKEWHRTSVRRLLARLEG